MVRLRFRCVVILVGVANIYIITLVVLVNLQNNDTNEEYSEKIFHLEEKTDQLQNSLNALVDGKQPAITNDIITDIKTSSLSSAPSTSVMVSTSLCDDPVPGNRQVISYSLFGKKAEQLGRFIEDVSREALSIDPYKRFTLRIYVDSEFSNETREKYRRKLPNVRFCDVTRVPEYGDLSFITGTVWRFIAMADPTVDLFCSRDLDSPLLQRGGDAVNEFLKTNSIMHTMRDRSLHSVPIMGGMWCFRPNLDLNLAKKLLKKILIRASGKRNPRFDQIIIGKVLWPLLKGRTLQHDAYNCMLHNGSKSFPTQRRNHYVGCVRDCHVYGKEECPIECRPANHLDWIYC